MHTLTVHNNYYSHIAIKTHIYICNVLFTEARNRFPIGRHKYNIKWAD